MCFIFNYWNAWCSPRAFCCLPPRALSPADSRGWPCSQPGQALPGNEPLSHVRWINCLGQSNLILLVSSHTRVGLSNWSWGQGNDPYNLEMVGEEKDGLDVYFTAKYPTRVTDQGRMGRPETNELTRPSIPNDNHFFQENRIWGRLASALENVDSAC